MFVAVCVSARLCVRAVRVCVLVCVSEGVWGLLLLLFLISQLVEIQEKN